MLLGFDSFGDDLQAESVSQVDGCIDDQAIIGLGGQFKHEGLVDLENVQLQPA